MAWDIEVLEGCAVVSMNTNKVNVQNERFFADLHNAFDRLEREFAQLPARPETPARTDGEMTRNFLCGGRSNCGDATVDSVAHHATGALLQGVRPFLPHRLETRS
jgi:hypothetical protein